MDAAVEILYKTRMTQRTIHHESLHHVPEAGWTDCAFSVSRAGKLAAAPDYAIARSSQAGQDLLFCLSGAGTVRSLGLAVDVEPGQLVWLANEAPHGHSAHPRRPWTLAWLRLNGPNLPLLRQKLLRNGAQVFDIGEKPVLLSWFERLFSAMRLRHLGLDVRLNQLVAELIAILEASASGIQTERASQLLPAMTAMRENLAKPWTAEEIAALSALSASQVRRHFQKHLRMSPRQWLLRERLIQAQSLMVGTAEPLAEIAVHCGFCDVYHFSRAFRRFVGNTPAAWRREESSV